MALGLKDRVALVASASKGLGFGVAKALAQNGAKVSICSRTQTDIDSAARRLAVDYDVETMGTACDVTSKADIDNWVKRTVDQWGGIDALLVNAGGPPAATFKEITEDQWQAAFELTLMSTVRMIRAAIPHMKSGSAILTITSSSVREPIPRLGLSTVMRAGVIGLVKTLADELANDGIRVNNLIPGRIDTDRVAQLDRGTAEKLGITPEEARARSVAKIPLGRLGTIYDFGAAGAFLLSPAASYSPARAYRSTAVPCGQSSGIGTRDLVTGGWGVLWQS